MQTPYNTFSLLNVSSFTLLPRNLEFELEGIGLNGLKILALLVLCSELFKDFGSSSNFVVTCKFTCQVFHLLCNLSSFGMDTSAPEFSLMLQYEHFAVVEMHPKGLLLPDWRFTPWDTINAQWFFASNHTDQRYQWYELRSYPQVLFHTNISYNCERKRSSLFFFHWAEER